jgi:hypothetical protein
MNMNGNSRQNHARLRSSTDAGIRLLLGQMALFIRSQRTRSVLHLQKPKNSQRKIVNL